MSVDFDDKQIYATLLKACKNHSVDPSSSLEAEKFFRELLLTYDGESDLTSISNWLNENIGKSFVALGDKPKWLQGAEWPFANNQPMIFAGQIDWHVRDGELVSKTFHDDTSFYLFISLKVRPVVIMQQK